VNSHTTTEFRKGYALLPPHIRQIARKQYRLWKGNTRHPSLAFKKVGAKVWSARITEGWRALAVEIPGGYLWIWIGAHDQYMRVIRSV
jgi:hypothetical protein